MNKKINRNIDLSNLPSYYKGIDWKNSIGYSVDFSYNGVVGLFKIIYYEYPYVIINYDNSEYKILVEDIKKCGLGSIFNVSTLSFKYDIGKEFHDNNRNIVLTDKLRIIKNNMKIKHYKFTCLQCGWTEGIINETMLKRGCGCNCCKGTTVVEGINDIPTTDSWMISYFQNGYNEAKSFYKGSTQTIYPKCPDCGKVKSTKMMIREIFKHKGITCNCGDGISYPNKLMFNILEQLGITFICEYSPEWIKPKKYDFYFELHNQKYIIEMDGGLGHGKKVYKSSKLTPDETLEIDIYKEYMAVQNNISIIRVDCDYTTNIRSEFIKQNIISNTKLNDIFDFSLIDWNLCEEYALKNLTKTVCDYKALNNNSSTKDIGILFKLGTDTIATYLKRGSKLGWCKYSPEEEKQKAMKRSKNRKDINPVLCVNKNLVFYNLSECQRQSVQLFGEKFYTNSISKNIRGLTSTYKGLIFKYITKQEFNTIKSQSPELAFGDYFIIQNEETQAS